jgi:hypothetical protein
MPRDAQGRTEPHPIRFSRPAARPPGRCFGQAGPLMAQHADTESSGEAWLRLTTPLLPARLPEGG